MKFVKKPVVIEAIQWNGTNKDEIIKFTNNEAFLDTSKDLFGVQLNDMYIHTLEGDMKANLNDWIIKGVNGEYYPCKDNIFKKTYDKV